MFYFESEDFLSQYHKDFITLLRSQELQFPFYYEEGSVYKEDGANFMCHTLITRLEEREKIGNVEQLGVNSPHTEMFLQMANSLCVKAEIERPKEWFRAAVNFTYPIGIDKSLTHDDHEFPHRQILIYLNKPMDKTATTVLLDEQGNKVKEVIPQQFKGIIFDSTPHYMNYPKVGNRMVAVFTFK